MLSPLDLFKSYFTFEFYYNWFLLTVILFSGFLFVKRKYYHTHTNTWKGYLIYFLIIIVGFSLVYRFFKHQEPSSKYLGQLIGKIDENIDKRDQTANNLKSLESKWEFELKKTEEELKTLYAAKEINEEQQKKTKEALIEAEKKIKDFKTKNQETEKNIDVLKEQKKQKLKEKAKKEEEINKIEEQLKKTNEQNEKQKLETRLEELQNEHLKLIKQISDIKRDISNLEATKEMYEGMISDATLLRDELDKDYYQLNSNGKTLFNQIKNIQERQSEIQKNIDEIKQKQAEIQEKKNLLRILKEKFQIMHVQFVTHEQENKFSFGNFTKFAFKAADVLSDFYPPTASLKILSKGPKLTRGFVQPMTLLLTGLHETHSIYRMFNQVANENKETPIMLDKESLSMYLDDIQRETEQFEADFKDYQKKLDMYQSKLVNDDLNKQEIQKEKNQTTEFKEYDRQKLGSYREMVKTLTHLRNQTSDLSLFQAQENILNSKLNKLQKELNITEDEVYNQEKPSEKRVQQRLYNIPEMITIPNK
ncbi:DNA double-strand break repair protein Rad50 [Candidatus Phytoplasma phoenicium]|uniref:DNA double-strand break repair protein Rad50 n=1 Tax=Candidatus Phytoplasma phoenicium TaxID=198422 RepID=A0A2S8NUX7_9MOLU|nr:DNA double-strand break repair protein Rad50 [Candidatus Phytoplasma phoenicium]